MLWREEEVKYLDGIVTNYPLSRVVTLYQRKAKREKWPHRTGTAIRKKVRSRYGGNLEQERNFLLSHIARILGISWSRVTRWRQSGRLRCRQVNRRYYVLDHDLRAFAKQYPELFADAEWSAIAYLLGDELADYVCQFEYIGDKIRRPKAVYDKRTGRIYPSIQAAADHLSFSTSGVRKLIKKGAPSGDNEAARLILVEDFNGDRTA